MLIPLVIVPDGDTLVYEMGDAQISNVFRSKSLFVGNQGTSVPPPVRYRPNRGLSGHEASLHAKPDSLSGDQSCPSRCVADGHYAVAGELRG